MRSTRIRNLTGHKWSVLSLLLSVACYLVIFAIIGRLDALHLWIPGSLAAKRLASAQMAAAVAAMALGGVALRKERPMAWGAVAVVVGFLCFASAAA
jgi:hypothetical protein